MPLLVCRQMPSQTTSSCRRFPLVWVVAGLLAALASRSGAAGIVHPAAAAPVSAQPADSSVSAAVFPTLSAEALDRTQLLLPAQLEGKQNLLLLSWARDQASQLDTWTAVAQALQHSSFDFRVYRMLVSVPENTLFRWWDSASLRAAETDPELLHWDVPIYTDKIALRRSLGLSSDDHLVAAVLVDRSGHVLWKTQGPSTEQSRAALLAAAKADR